MSPNLDTLLCEKYPKIFANRFKSPTETAMCWGFECGDGWYNILNALCFQIQEHIDWNNRQRERLLESNPYNAKIPDEVSQVVAIQVKEKYGSLRFYYDGGDDRIYGMVCMAETMSAVTCEVCGDRGSMRGHSWFYTACDKHTKDYDLVDNTTTETENK